MLGSQLFLALSGSQTNDRSWLNLLSTTVLVFSVMSVTPGCQYEKGTAKCMGYRLLSLTIAYVYFNFSKSRRINKSSKME